MGTSGALMAIGHERQGFHTADPDSSAASQPGTRAGLDLLAAELGAARSPLQPWKSYQQKMSPGL